MRQRQELLSEIAALMQREREALQSRDAAFQRALQTQRHEFHLELEALRAELQAERASFHAALEELKYVNRHSLLADESKRHTETIQSLAKSVDAALMTLILNVSPERQLPG